MARLLQVGREAGRHSRIIYAPPMNEQLDHHRLRGCPQASRALVLVGHSRGTRVTFKGVVGVAGAGRLYWSQETSRGEGHEDTRTRLEAKCTWVAQHS